jgi:hypothetical protein
MSPSIAALQVRAHGVDLEVAGPRDAGPNNDSVGGVRGCHPQVRVARALVVTVRVEGLGSAYALAGTVTVAAIVAAIAASIEIFTVAYFWSR